MLSFQLVIFCVIFMLRLANFTYCYFLNFHANCLLFTCRFIHKLYAFTTEGLLTTATCTPICRAKSTYLAATAVVFIHTHVCYKCILTWLESCAFLDKIVQSLKACKSGSGDFSDDVEGHLDPQPGASVSRALLALLPLS